MGIFGDKNKETKEEKAEKQLRQLLSKYGLEDMQTIDQKDRESVQKIILDLAGTGLMRAGMAMSFGKAEEQVKVQSLTALIEQNWIIIRQLDRITQRLDDLRK